MSSNAGRNLSELANFFFLFTTFFYVVAAQKLSENISQKLIYIPLIILPESHKTYKV